jgi:hypothetical protein
MNGFKQLIGASIVLAIVGIALGGDSESPATRPATTEPAATQPSGVLEPVKEGTTQPADPPAGMREGTMIDLTGQITYNTKHEAMLRFRPRDDAPFKTLPILPNRNLARMEAALDTHGKDTWFNVSVLVTVYENHNYLQIRDVALAVNKPS